jgi:hypothetical protein
MNKMPIQTPVTGNEEPIEPREPFGALAEFYRAFNRRDTALMERNWDCSDEASMDNPLGAFAAGGSKSAPSTSKSSARKPTYMSSSMTTRCIASARCSLPSDVSAASSPQKGYPWI